MRHAEHFKKLTEGQDRHIAPSQCAATTVLAAPADGLLEEPELIVATSCEKTLISAPDVYNDRGHAHAVKAGDTIYTSAQIPVDKNGNLPSEEFEAQAEQVFLNLGSVLKAARASWSQVVKMNTYLRRREDYATLVGIRDRYMPESSVVVTDLVSGPVDPRFLLQAECVVATS